MSSSTIVLNDSTIPAVSDLAGSLLSGSTQHGTSEIAFRATDTGPGVYSGQLVVDGQEQPAVVLDSNNGWCENLGQTTDGTRAFAHPTPCPAELSSSLALDTTKLTDGTHTVKLIVQDWVSTARLAPLSMLEVAPPLSELSLTLGALLSGVCPINGGAPG